MTLRSNQLGAFEVSDKTSLFLPDGILGFEDLKKYSIVENADAQPFMWLVSQQDPEVCFAVVDPDHIVEEGYEAHLSESDHDTLDLQPGDPISVFVLVSSSDGGRKLTVNLKGPVVLNLRNRVAKQVVVYNPAYGFRQPLLPDGEAQTGHAPERSQRLSALR